MYCQRMLLSLIHLLELYLFLLQIKLVLNIYEKVKANQQLIDELQSEVSDDNLQKVLALKQTNVALQQQLMQGCAAYRDYTKYLSHTWRDVQAKLEKNVIAIEFTTVPLSNISFKLIKQQFVIG